MPYSRADRQRMFQQNLGRAVRRFRTERGLKQRDVAQRSSLSVEYLSRLENGRANPTVLTLMAVVEDGMDEDLKRFCRHMTGPHPAP